MNFNHSYVCEPNNISIAVENTPTHSKGIKIIFYLGNKANPFADWTIVFVPYCTADVHIGAAIGNYSGKVLHHQGRANSQSALNYIFNKHSEASEFFVTGSSAGSIGASFYAGVIANKFPDVSITWFNDGSGGLVTDNNIDLMTILGASSGIPSWVFEKQLNDKSFTLNKTTSAELVIFNWLNRKDMRFGRFDDSKDSTIINFNTLLGSSKEEYIEKIQKAESLIEENGIEISGFIAKGSAFQHILNKSNTYIKISLKNIHKAKNGLQSSC